MPNNWASLAPFRMTIPEGCILNAPRPYPVSVRHVIGHLLPDLMMGCLHQAVPDAGHGGGLVVPVESAAARRRRGVGPGARQPAGGAGFRDHHLQLRRHRRAAHAATGWTRTAFPSGVRTMPVEATENVAPLVFWRKELRPDSRRRRAHPRRPRAGDGDRHQGRSRIRRATPSSTGRQPAEGPRRRLRGRAGGSS